MSRGGVFQSETESTVTVEQDVFDTTEKGEDVKRYRLTNHHGVQMEVIELGVILTALRVPDKNGHLDDIVLGFEDLKGYEDNAYFGAMIGRYANRIKGSKFTLDGVTHKLSNNEGENQVHGGVVGWCRRVWKSRQEGNHVVFSYYSPAGEDGYPGDVITDVMVQLTDDDQVVLTIEAKALTEPTPVNISWHPYFNLAGEGADNIYDHELTIYADKYMPYCAKDLTSTGEIKNVTGDACDFKEGKMLGPLVHDIPEGSLQGSLFNIDYSLRGPPGKRLASRLVHGVSGRVMTIFTNQTDLEFYTGDFLDAKGGKNDHHYKTHSGIILMTQGSTDALNNPNFPDSILRPGSTYYHKIWHQFSTTSN